MLSGPQAASAQELEVHSAYAEAEGGELYYEVAGEGMPLVLIHGGAMDRRMWDDQFAVLAEQYRVVRYDIRGFGDSPAAAARFMPSEDLVTLLDALSIERAHVVGLSLGGGIAVDFALAHPERVAGLVLAEPGIAGWQFSPEIMRTMGGVLAALQRGDMEEALELFLDSPALRSAKDNPEAFEKIERLVRQNFGGIRSQMMMDFAEPRAIDGLARIEAPTLILVSENAEGDARAIAKRLEADVPKAKRAEIAGAGHMMNIEQPARFNATVLDFLARLKGR
jgi:pimeloyl-ACP methyl ester carboxylesterase